jgi:Na+/H+ antiporter NhaC
MPDTWEYLHGFNPYDPLDASQDIDHDSITNIQEYKDSIDPAKKLSPSEFFARLKENWTYLIASVIIFVMIIFLARYGIRRKNNENLS